jgi:hypothetical protein
MNIGVPMQLIMWSPVTIVGAGPNITLLPIVNVAREQNICEKRGIETLFPNVIFSKPKYIDVDGFNVTLCPQLLILLL